jgi:hypothetical protein
MLLAMRHTISIVVAAVLLGAAWLLPHVRHRLIEDIITWDAVPTAPAVLPSSSGPGSSLSSARGTSPPSPFPPLASLALRPGLPEVRRVRVVLVDGLAADTAHTLPTYAALCKRGIDLTVDVGFPTVSLPVEVALWTGLTQQQTGIVFRSDRPIDPPLAHSIPAQVPGSRAIAENHGYIARSLGFGQVESDGPLWQQHARDAVAGDARLVFVHVLRVDTAGHQHGHDSPEYRAAASEADAMVTSLVDAAPDARWFVLSDHGHLPGGGHGGEERSVRQVEDCIIGPGIAPQRGQLVHVVDVARALADSLGVTLDPASRGRPMSVALAAPLGPDQAVPPTALGPGVAALFVLVLGFAVATVGMRRWWLAPWWFVAACVLLIATRGEPTLSMPMVYAPTGRAMYVTWLPALAIAAVTTFIALGRQPLWRVVVAQLALPLGVLASVITVCGAWAAFAGAEVAPVVPRFTAWMSPLILIVAHGMAAVALAVLGTLVRSAFGRQSPPAPPRSEPAAG